MNKNFSLVALMVLLIQGATVKCLGEQYDHDEYQISIINSSNETIHYRVQSTIWPPICGDACTNESDPTGNDVTDTTYYCCKNEQNGVGDLKPGERKICQMSDRNVSQVFVFPHSGGKWSAKPKQDKESKAKGGFWTVTHHDLGSLTYNNGDDKQRGDFTPAK